LEAPGAETTCWRAAAISLGSTVMMLISAMRGLTPAVSAFL
jgi:hypothetical protein